MGARTCASDPDCGNDCGGTTDPNAAAGIRSGHVLWASDGLWVPAGDASAADDAAGNGATAADANGDYDGAASRRLRVRAGSGAAAGIRSGHVIWASDGLRAAA